MPITNIENPKYLSLSQSRELLKNADSRFLKRKVRCVAQDNELDDPRVEALYNLACGRQFQWTPKDWETIVNTLDECDMTVEEWINTPEQKELFR